MQLNINSPSYYKNEFGVDSEIYWMCREICDFVSKKDYGECRIGITPIAAPLELIQKGEWEEETQYQMKSNLIIVKRHMDYEKYVSSSIEEKKMMILGNILRSLKAVKAKGKIPYDQLEQDVLEFLGYTREEIKPYCQ